MSCAIRSPICQYTLAVRDFFTNAGARIRRLWGLVVLFVVLRLLLGVAFIAFNGGIARSYELTLLCLIAVVVYVGVALAVRRWAPPRRAS
jgi:hypothetical protein